MNNCSNIDLTSELSSPRRNDTQELAQVDGINSNSLISDQLNRTILVQTQKVSPGEWTDEARKWQNHKENNKTVNGKIIKNCDGTGDVVMNNRAEKYFGLSSSSGREKKWWRMLKWLPGTKVFKFARRQRNYGGTVVSNVESTREEYSMTTCYVANSGGHRLV